MRKKFLLEEFDGLKFGEWTVLGRDWDAYNRKPRRCAWICQCSCGAVKSVDKQIVRDRSSKMCKECSNRAQRGNPDKNLTKTYYSSIQSTAAYRQLEFTLSMGWLQALYEAQDKKCWLTGLPIEFGQTSRSASDGTASLDRIDSKKGYVPGNVQWVHKVVNIVKNSLEQEYFFLLCRMISEKKYTPPPEIDGDFGPVVPPSTRDKLSKRDMEDIYKLDESGMTAKAIADQFGVCVSTVSRLIAKHKAGTEYSEPTINNDSPTLAA